MCVCVPLAEDIVIGKSAAVSAAGVTAASPNRADLFNSSDSQSRSKLPDDTDRQSPLCLCLLKLQIHNKTVTQVQYKKFTTHNTISQKIVTADMQQQMVSITTSTNLTFNLRQ